MMRNSTVWLLLAWLALALVPWYTAPWSAGLLSLFKGAAMAPETRSVTTPALGQLIWLGRWWLLPLVLCASGLCCADDQTMCCWPALVACFSGIARLVDWFERLGLYGVQ
ncbi:MAG: hypothetical protein R3F53_26025 [Gammaproteobacteria bacterium]